MKKYFMGLKWNGENQLFMHLKDCFDDSDEYVSIPKVIYVRKINSKKCIGAINPYTMEYISCNNTVVENQTQCYKCMHLFDFYKCIRCHGENCLAKNRDVINYCNTSHFVYLAYFSKEKIKVGTASEIRKYDRLVEQGAIFSIFIAKTPNGKIARQIEKSIIDNGIAGVVTTVFKMKNIVLDNSLEEIKKLLLRKYQEIIGYVDDENVQYLIEPEFNHFDMIRQDIDNSMLSHIEQIDLFSSKTNSIREFNISNNYDIIEGKFLFAVGKIIALDNNGRVELYDSKKLEGFLLDFTNLE